MNSPESHHHPSPTSTPFTNLYPIADLYLINHFRYMSVASNTSPFSFSSPTSPHNQSPYCHVTKLHHTNKLQPPLSHQPTPSLQHPLWTSIYLTTVSTIPRSQKPCSRLKFLLSLLFMSFLGVFVLPSYTPSSLVLCLLFRYLSLVHFVTHLFEPFDCQGLLHILFPSNIANQLYLPFCTSPLIALRLCHSIYRYTITCE